ncbi:MAG: hypothetical protein NTX25_04625, partial [Proteobacteria bacterium]|nr:hypothetical protein [Pseudomonadota bacterium]
QLLAQVPVEPGTISERPQEWSRAIRGFRGEHNFSIGYGYAVSQWQVHLSGHDEPIHFETRGHQVCMAYSFHLPIWQGVGYALGTRSSVLMDASANQEKGSELSYGLPGLHAGLVWNISDHLRVGSGLEFGWQRIDQLRLPKIWNQKQIAITGETRSYYLAADYFYELSWALHLDYELTRLSYLTTESIDLYKNSKTWSLGILKHLI